jgi:UDP-N-acetylglucosamine 2-epimerase (non-hydrolysing)
MTRRLRIMSVVGTRPNFMKMAPVIRELGMQREAFHHLLVHTGQHYDYELSQVFIEQLGVGQPDFFLGAGSGTRADQVARVMERLAPILRATRPDLVLVPGDVNSTLASTLAAAMVGIPVGHVEAGLRCFDSALPEEINRIVVDSLSRLLFIHSPEARENLVREGCDEGTIHYVGNTMIDTLLGLIEQVEALDAPASLGLERSSYLAVTLHRHWLFGNEDLLRTILVRLAELSEELPVIFPMHPRTRAMVDGLGIGIDAPGFRLLPSLGYLEFLGLLAAARAVLTDSGGIQEETTFLGIPCFTLRPSTERPITVEMGTNVILGLDPHRIADVPRLLRDWDHASVRIPPLWDGNAAKRIVEALGTSAEIWECRSRDVGSGREPRGEATEQG